MDYTLCAFWMMDRSHKWMKTATERTEIFEKKLLKLIFSVISVAKKTFKEIGLTAEMLEHGR